MCVSIDVSKYQSVIVHLGSVDKASTCGMEGSWFDPASFHINFITYMSGIEVSKDVSNKGRDIHGVKQSAKSGYSR